MPKSQSNVVALKPRAKAQSPVPHLPPLDDLSFVSRGSRRWPDGGGYCYWDVEKAARHHGVRGSALGERLATEYAAYIVRSGYACGAFNLIAIVADMPPPPPPIKAWTGAEQAFLREVDRLFGIGAYVRSMADGRPA